MRNFRFTARVCLLLSITAGTCSELMASEHASKFVLRDHWAIQSSEKIKQDGRVISTPSFKPAGWYPTSVPSTVLNALVNNKVYPDPYYGMNLRSLPGMEYTIGDNFSNLPMPETSPFRRSWWYRTAFRLPADWRGRRVWLHFVGINYRANVWLNCEKVAGADKMAGAWRLFEFDITRLARPEGANVLAVEVFPPQPDDLAITFVDWNPLPPDKDMGLWRDVYLTASGPVTLRHPQVITHLEPPSLDTAHLTVTAEARNATDQPVRGTLKGAIENINFSQEVELAPGETKTVQFAPDRYPQLNLRGPRLWWPWQMGAPILYELKLEFEAGDKVSDRVSTRFGIREVTSEMTGQDYRLFKINGRPILIRGAGGTFDMLLRDSPEREENEVRYVKDMHLNTIRLEGKLEDEHFFDVCDREGILVLAGWCCCDHWEKWKNWKEEDHAVARESLRDQLRRLRNHPSVFDWLYGSDNPPPPDVEKMYIQVLQETRWPNPYQSSATAKITRVTGKTGLKMTGPYEYVAPSYWLLDHERGGAQGFNTETGPGPAVPPIESLRRFIPAGHLWPIDSVWDFHAGGGAFKNIHVFAEAIKARYGESSGVEEFAEKAQVMAYEGERAMFEAYGRNKYTSTGVIQWMLNNAWPSLIWHLYDYYLRPGGAYFGAQKACEPVHIQYSYDDNSVWVVNSTYEAVSGLHAAARVFNLDMSEKFSQTATLDLAADESRKVLSIPEIASLSPTYFVRLDLDDSAGKPVSSNFYWLPTKRDVLDWDNSTWYYTPTKEFSDLKALATLPKVPLQVTSSNARSDGEGTTTVTVENPAKSLAFFVRMKVTEGKNGDEVLPVLWEDNYFSLLPGEKREVKATYALKDLGGASPEVEVEGWNVERP